MTKYEDQTGSVSQFHHGERPADPLLSAPSDFELLMEGCKDSAGNFHEYACLGVRGVTFGCAGDRQQVEIDKMKKHATGKAYLHPRCEAELRPKAEPWPSALRHKNSAERKAEPVHSGVVLYFPDAMAAKARLSKAGNDKHNPGMPLHWARGKSTDHLECAIRHLMEPDAIDPETGETNLVAAGWRVDAALQLQQERILREKGILPYSGVAS